MQTKIRNVKFTNAYLKMFITAVCVVFLIKLRWPKSKSLYSLNFDKQFKHFDPTLL